MVTLASAADLPPPAVMPATTDTSGDLIIVAVRDAPEVRPAVGGTPYAGRAGYAGGTRALAEAESVALDHGLREESAWTIAPLRWRCMLYRLAAGADRTRVLAALARDPRVQLAQPLNEFETLATPAPRPSDALAYDDPYVGLQRGFAAMHVAEAQRWSQGSGVRIAVIDSGIDTTHPDLLGRVAVQRDFAAADHPPAAEGERHGTEIAGVIAAGANNGIGIVGIAPLARLLAYRACWPVAFRDAVSRCNSFTLARAFGAAIADGAEVINLSLGGPPDALLRTLAEYAMQQGAIVVGALPSSGRAEGFPAGVTGVVAVGASGETANDSRALLAPGQEILTLVPGGGYDYASGSSLAAAHVTGVVALLRALNPALRAGAARAALVGSEAGDAVVDACRAVRRWQASAHCVEVDATARDVRSFQP